VRDIEQSQHFKFITYSKWFKPFTEDKDYLSVYHLLRAKEIRTVAAFRMCGHQLNIEAMRHRRVPRAERLCTLCGAGAVEDELHVFECQAYAGLRLRFGFDTEDEWGDPDSYMRAIVNPGNVTSEWRRLASFLIAVFAHRESLIHPSA
jgi:hypothetical protein